MYNSKECVMPGRAKWWLFLCAMALSISGCTNYGKVEQGRVIGYDRKTGEVILIRDSTGGQRAKPAYDSLPPISVKSPQDPDEMGPAPQAGKLMRVDLKRRELVIYDTAISQFRTIPYIPIEERHNVAKASGLPAVDKVKKTIAVYSAPDRTVVAFPASDELLAMPSDTWKTGDEVRYYYKDPAQSLRMMNVSKTDLNKS
jgi:hypothetical protein